MLGESENMESLSRLSAVNRLSQSAIPPDFPGGGTIVRRQALLFQAHSAAPFFHSRQDRTTSDVRWTSMTAPSLRGQHRGNCSSPELQMRTLRYSLRRVSPLDSVNGGAHNPTTVGTGPEYSNVFS
jgi:hypothetical protein